MPDKEKLAEDLKNLLPKGITGYTADYQRYGEFERLMTVLELLGFKLPEELDKKEMIIYKLEQETKQKEREKINNLKDYIDDINNIM